jgi:hypothetical protein
MLNLELNFAAAVTRRLPPPNFAKQFTSSVSQFALPGDPLIFVRYVMLTVAHAVVSVLFGVFTKQYLFVIGDAPQMMTEHFPAISRWLGALSTSCWGCHYICSAGAPWRAAVCGVPYVVSDVGRVVDRVVPDICCNSNR